MSAIFRIHTMVSPSSLQKGNLLGKYKLLRRLGAGAYGEVWKSLDTVENVQVALKIGKKPANVEDHNRLFREISLLTRLEHPNIVRIKNADTFGDWIFIATELGQRSLDDIKLPVSLLKAVAMTQQVLSALEYAHRRNIIHRDVKPENVILFSSGVVKLADFGIAKAMDATMTMSDAGTVEFRAPEQAYGNPSRESDIFSAGLMLTYLLTRRIPTWPFKWPYPGVKRYQWKFPGALSSVLLKATEIHVSRRYKSASQFRNALEKAVRIIRGSAEIGKGKKRKKSNGAIPHWQEIRFRQFRRTFGKFLALNQECKSCGGPVSEAMLICPWCGERYSPAVPMDNTPSCKECGREIKNDWKYCPWCYRPQLKEHSNKHYANKLYIGNCHKCGGDLMRFMRYCPWCHSKAKPWTLRELKGKCPRCSWSVSPDEWAYCPWCEKRLET